MIIPEIKAPPIVAVLLALTASDRAIGGERDHPADQPIARPAAWHGGPEHAPLHQHLDARFAHDHYYFDPGYRFPGPPGAGIDIVHGPDHFWYDHGEWYRHDWDGWVVVGAPVGIFVPVLPTFYTTIWFGGVPYYYANDTYYSWNAQQNEYQVVDPPAGIESGAAVGDPPSDKIFAYPSQGQSAQQQSRDQYDCYRFAVGQTGFDPTRPDGGVSGTESASKRNDYLRADGACLEGRGYSVK